MRAVGYRGSGLYADKASLALCARVRLVDYELVPELFDVAAVEHALDAHPLALAIELRVLGCVLVPVWAERRLRLRFQSAGKATLAFG